MTALAKALYALKSPDGLKAGSFIVRCQSRVLGIDVAFEGSNIVVRFDRPLKVDHTNSAVNWATDGHLMSLRLTVDGRVYASVEIRGPFGYITNREVPL